MRIKRNLALTSQDNESVLEQIDDNIIKLKQSWDSENPPSPSFWSFGKIRLISGTKFIIDSLDKMILFVEDLIPAGTDKKAAVTLVSAKLFDYIVVAGLPIWLKPFSSIVKSISVNVIISSIIDFVVNKYNQGIWKKENKNV